MKDFTDFVTIGQAARALSLSPQRVRQMVSEGRIAAVRGPLNMRLLDRASIERMAAQRKEKVGGRAGAGR